MNCNKTYNCSTGCTSIVSGRCVIYTGTYLPLLAISTNDDLNTVINKINSFLMSGGGGGLSQVYTEDSPTVTWSGLGTLASPLIATAVGAGSGNLQQVTDLGSTTTNNMSIYSDTAESSTFTISNLPSNSVMALQTYVDEITGDGTASILMQGFEDNIFILSNNDLRFLRDDDTPLVTIHTNGRMSGMAGTLPNNFATVSQVILNGTGVQTSSSFNIDGRAIVTQATPAAVTGSPGAVNTSPLTVTGGAGGSTSSSTGTPIAGNAGQILIKSGNGGSLTGTPTSGFAGNAGFISILGGDGGQSLATGTTSGNGGDIEVAGGTSGIGSGGTIKGRGGYVSLKGGNAGVGGNSGGGNVYVVPGIPTGSGLPGGIFLGLSPSDTVRGTTFVGCASGDLSNGVGKSLYVRGVAQFVDNPTKGLAAVANDEFITLGQFNTSNNFVLNQTSTPGIPQTGNLNLTGTVRGTLGRFQNTTFPQLSVYYSDTVGLNINVPSTGQVTFQAVGSSTSFSFNAVTTFVQGFKTNSTTNSSNIQIPAAVTSTTDARFLVTDGAASTMFRAAFSGLSTDVSPLNSDITNVVLSRTEVRTQVSSINPTMSALLVLPPTLITGQAPVLGATVIIDSPTVGALDNYSLLVNSGSSKFNGGILLPIRAVTATATMTAADHTLIVNNGAVDATITLPAHRTGSIFVIKRTSTTNNVILTPPSGQIDGAATYTITSANVSITVQSDGTNYFII